MSTAKHTPGPWAAHLPAADEPSCFLVVTDDGHGNGVHLPCREGDPEAEANRRLIAAAPDMLDALQATEAEILRIASFLVGYGDAAELGAKHLRKAAERFGAAIARATT